MVKGKAFGLSAALGVLLLAAMAVPAQAASSTPITGTITLTSMGDPARLWVDEDGIVHIRDQPTSGSLSGDLEGTISISGNVNVNPATGAGDTFGSFVITTGQGTWAGRYSGTISGGLASVEFVGNSPDGSKIMGTVVELSPGIGAVEGVILNPKG